MNTRSDFDWTDTIISRMRVLWDEGLSTSEIARRLGTTKNSVIGKAHRLGFPGRPTPIRRGGPTKVCVRRRAEIPRLTEIVQLAAEDVSPALTAAAAVEAVPHTAPKTELLTLTVTSGGSDEPVFRGRKARPCAWPIGEPGKPGFGFCGAPSSEGRSYCTAHHQIAYTRRQPAKKTPQGFLLGRMSLEERTFDASAW